MLPYSLQNGLYWTILNLIKILSTKYRQMSEINENQPTPKNDFLEASKFQMNSKFSVPKKRNFRILNSVNVMKYLPWIAIAVVIIGAGGIAVWQYNKVQKLNQQLIELKKNPQQASEDITKSVVEKVGKLIILPEGEQPTLATVSDPSKLKNQPFFANAEIGDRVLIYSNAKKAILYSEKDNKIKEVAPINTDNNPAGATGTSTQATQSPSPANSTSSTPSQ